MVKVKFGLLCDLQCSSSLMIEKECFLQGFRVCNV